MNLALALLLGSAVPSLTPSTPNLDFATGRLTGWEGQGFYVTTGTGQGPSLAAGVCSSDCGQKGRTGLLYRGGADALAACMARYAAAPELAWQPGEAGWHEARRRHSTEAYAAQIYAVLRGVRQARGV